jgi:hypothetical protein
MAGDDFDHAVLDADDGDVEGAAAEVVDDDALGLALARFVGQRRRSRLVEDADGFQSGDLASLARRLALRVGEIGGNGETALRTGWPMRASAISL